MARGILKFVIFARDPVHPCDEQGPVFLRNGRKYVENIFNIKLFVY